MPKKDVTDELIASLHEAKKILEGSIEAGRVHHADVPGGDRTDRPVTIPGAGSAVVGEGETMAGV